MSHQQSQEDNQPEWQQLEELQQPNRQAVLPSQAMPAICQVIGVLAYITYEIMIDCIAAHYNHIPYHTSIVMRVVTHVTQRGDSFSPFDS
jgi:hypothetical protein